MQMPLLPDFPPSLAQTLPDWILSAGHSARTPESVRTTLLVVHDKWNKHKEDIIRRGFQTPASSEHSSPVTAKGQREAGALRCGAGLVFCLS